MKHAQHRHHTLALLALWSCLLVSAQGCTELGERAHVRGQICLQSCASGGQLSGVEVTLKLATEPSATPRPVQRTNAEGQFAFTNVSASADYVLEVTDTRLNCASITGPLPTQPPITLTCDWAPSQLKTNLGCGLELQGVVLTRADLAGIDLTGSDLSEANLIEANLSGATLTGADLSGARLSEARLVDAELSGRATGCAPSADGAPTRLIGAALRGADLTDARLGGADLTDANLNGADLSGADLSGADLSDANLQAARVGALHGCPLTLTEGWRCQPLASPPDTYALLGRGADLTSATLAALDLTGARLDGATLRGADLTDTDLTGADLTDADLTGALLDGVRAVDLPGCPDRLPTGWRCVRQPDHPTLGSRRFALAGPHADLNGVDLTGADFSDADLSGADLRNAYLRDALLDRSVLTGVQAHALLSGCPATLPHPWLCVFSDHDRVYRALIGPSANLSDAILTGARLSDAVLIDADLRRADLSRATLDGADLRGADISSALLSDTHMHRTRAYNLRGCPVIEGFPTYAGTPAELGDCAADVAGPAPWRCVEQPGPLKTALIGPTVSLSGADLSGADLSGANLTGADFSGADLTGADLGGVPLGCAVWTGATCPDGTPADTNGDTCVRHQDAP